jgi:hypothetical protein
VSFASDAQIARACLALLAPLRLVERGYWAEDGRGPTSAALDLVEGRGCPLSSGEQLVVRVALDFWNGHGGATIGEIAGRLDESVVRAIAGLLMASVVSPAAVEAWIESQRILRGRAERAR